MTLKRLRLQLCAGWKYPECTRLTHIQCNFISSVILRVHKLLLNVFAMYILLLLFIYYARQAIGTYLINGTIVVKDTVLSAAGCLGVGARRSVIAKHMVVKLCG